MREAAGGDDVSLCGARSRTWGDSFYTSSEGVGKQMQLRQCFLMGGVRGAPDVSSGQFLYFIQLPKSVILMEEAQARKAYTSLRGMKVMESLWRSL